MKYEKPLTFKERFLILKRRVEKYFRNLGRKYDVKIEHINVDPTSVVLIPKDRKEAEKVIKHLNSERQSKIHSAEVKIAERPTQALYDTDTDGLLNEPWII